MTSSRVRASVSMAKAAVRHRFGAARVDDAGVVAQHDVLALHAQLDHQLKAGDAGGAAAG